jgi:hypothetical protein
MNVLAPDPGNNRLSVRTAVTRRDINQFISNEVWKHSIQSDLARQLGEFILTREKHFSFGATDDKDLTSFVQADAIVLTTQEYLDLCVQMYKKGHDDGSNAWAR